MKGEKGQSMIELAFFIPILVTFLIGVVEIGLLFHNYIMVLSISREAARAGSIGESDEEICALIAEAKGALVNTYFLKWEIGEIEIETPAGRVVGEPIGVIIPLRFYLTFKYGEEATRFSVPVTCVMRIQKA
ncbi:MAG: TadE/TadG family type IV pilus assembly protein [bacterium]|nr:TadE/TadG family type IV pilus assembly protein [bacterium]